MPTVKSNNLPLISRSFLCCLVALLLPVSGWSAQTVVLAASDSPPLHSPEMADNGALTQIVEAAFVEQGYAVEVRFMPWARAMASARSGAVDGMIGVWYSPERAANLRYSEPIVSQQMVFYTRAENPVEYVSFRQLAEQGAVLAYVRGYVYPPRLRGMDFNIYWVNKPEQYLKVLLGQRVDLILVHEEYFRYLLSQPQYIGASHQLVRVGDIVDVVNMHLVVSPRVPHAETILSDFNRGVRVLKQAGVVSNILRDHGLDTVVPVVEPAQEIMSGKRAE